MCHWVKKANVYHIYPLGFCGAPRYQSNEVQHSILKLIEWIPHMQEMHINALYIGPIWSSYEHGYDTSDYRLIDKRLGTNEDFKHVCIALHKANIRIILDGVFNHVGRDFWAFKDVQTHLQNSAYVDWFSNLDFTGTSPMQDPFQYDAWEGYYNLVKLNLQNQEVVQYLMDSVRMWMDEFKIDGLRLDAANCIDPSFFKTLKHTTKQLKSDFWLMGEIIHGDYRQWANDELLDSVTNYECYKGLWSSLNTKNYFEIAHSLQRQFAKGGLYEHLDLYNFVDNHDVNRVASTLKYANDLNNIYTLLYTMPGIPSIYYGSEYGIKGKKHNGSDADIRPCLTLDELQKTNTLLYDHLCKLGKLRTTLSTLMYGSYEQILIRNELFIFKRFYDDEVIYIALNISDLQVDIEFPVTDGNFIDVLHEQEYICSSILKATIQPHDAIICVPQSIRSVTNPIQLQPRIEQTMDQPHSTILLPGRYRHFKGKEYEVLYVAKHSETLEEYVVYKQLYGEESIWIRPLSMFQSIVEVDGNSLQRFTFIEKMR